MDAMREALRMCLDAMDMQEKREAGVLHIPGETALCVWRDAQSAARSVLSQEPGGAPEVSRLREALTASGWQPKAVEWFRQLEDVCRGASVGNDTMADTVGLCCWAISLLTKGSAVPPPVPVDWAAAAKRASPSPSPGEPGGAPSSPLVRSKEWWLRQADSEGPEDFDCTAGVPGPTTAERAAHWQQGAAAAYREQGMEHAASWYRARRLFSGMDTPAPAPLPSPGAPRIAPLCCPPEPTEHSECPHERTEAGWCAVCGEDVSGSPSPGEAPRLPFPVKVDPAMPEGTAEFRSPAGEVLGRIVNVAASPSAESDLRVRPQTRKPSTASS